MSQPPVAAPKLPSRSMGLKLIVVCFLALIMTIPAAFVWTGLEQNFVNAGFIEVARRSPKRPILRSKP